MTNKGTSVFVNMERFEERDTDFIIMVLYSNSRLLSIPKFLQFGKFVKNPVSYFLFAAGKNRTMCDAGEGEADDSAGGDSPTRGLKVPFGVLSVGRCFERVPHTFTSPFSPQ